VTQLAEDSRAPLAGAADGYDNAGSIPIEDPVPEGTGPARSLIEDIEALIDDGRTYLDAEVAFQKTRVAFISDRLKKTIAYAAVAAVLALLAAIGLVVGLILSLTPLITAWGATAVVVGLLLLGAFVLLRRAGRTWGRAMRAVSSDSDAGAEEG
jgi:hypothetical protein